MRSGKDIRKVEKRVVLAGWKWHATTEMTFEEALEVAQQTINNDPLVMGIRISIMPINQRRWQEEFSGDKEFNYIGIDL